MLSFNICLCLIYFTWYDNLLVHLCCCKWHYIILFYGLVIFLCKMCVSVCMYVHLKKRDNLKERNIHWGKKKKNILRKAWWFWKLSWNDSQRSCPWISRRNGVFKGKTKKRAVYMILGDVDRTPGHFCLHSIRGMLSDEHRGYFFQSLMAASVRCGLAWWDFQEPKQGEEAKESLAAASPHAMDLTVSISVSVWYLYH